MLTRIAVLVNIQSKVGFIPKGEYDLESHPFRFILERELVAKSSSVKIIPQEEEMSGSNFELPTEIVPFDEVKAEEKEQVEVKKPKKERSRARKP